MMSTLIMNCNTLKSTKFKGGDCVDKEFTVEELEKEIVRQDDYINELEKYNKALIEQNHMLKSQLIRKSASLGRSAKENIYR